MSFIELNGYAISVNNMEFTILQQCEQLNIEIPRFCYHERLSIAGNCRMCMVEIKSSIKPVISCSSTLVNGMVIVTDSVPIKKVRENILEFLLINHPLDCPICDQGGECDLQDQTIIYGSDKGRFKEMKRSVSDKNMGPFVKTIMTRCIHCTRCIRFLEEIAGYPVLGTMGRGRETEIGTYVDIVLNSEVSGNIIDLCPVGALTSKPYAFISRPWELSFIETIDIMDSLGSNIRIDLKGNTIMRILPRLNDKVNDEWISDKIRFSYDGLKNERITFPYVRDLVTDLFITVSWEQVYSYLYEQLYKLSRGDGSIHLYIGELMSVDVLAIMYNWISRLNINVYIKWNCCNLNVDSRSDYLPSYEDNCFTTHNIYILFNINLKKEATVLNIRLRKLVHSNGVSVILFGPYNMLNYNYYHLGITLFSFVNYIFSKLYFKEFYLQNKLLMVNERNQDLISSLSNVLNSNKLIVYDQLDKLGVLELGILSTFKENTNYLYKQYSKDDMLLLLNYNKHIDLLYGSNSVYIGHHGDWNAFNSNIIMPITAYVETRSYYINLEGLVQVSEKALYSPGNVIHATDLFSSLINYITYVYNSNIFIALLHMELISDSINNYIIHSNKLNSYCYNIVINECLSYNFDFYKTNVITYYSVNMSNASKIYNKSVNF